MSSSREEHTRPSTPAARWYAVGTDGESALRITPGLTIGETASGALALNDPDAARQWVTFDLSDPRRPMLRSRADVVLAEGGTRRLAEYPLQNGVILALPNNRLQISHHIGMPGPPGSMVEIRPAAAVDEGGDESVRGVESGQPEVVRAVFDLREQLGMSSPETDANRSALDSEPAAPEEPAEPFPEEPLEREPLIASIPEPPSEVLPGEERIRRPPERHRRDRSGSSTSVVLGLIAVGLGILAVALATDWSSRLPDYIGSDAEDSPLTTLEQGVRDEPAPDAAAAETRDRATAGPNPTGSRDARQTTTPNAATAGPTVEKPEAEAAAAAATVQPLDGNRLPDTGSPQQSREVPGDGATAGTTTADSNAGGSPADTRPTPADTADSGLAESTEADTSRDDAGSAVRSDPRLDRARRLLQDGDIITPPGDNAVTLLTDLRQEWPDSAAVRNLLDQCSTELLDTAVAYQANGLDYEARNILEEVLSFDPDNTEARQLWARWVGTPR